jgi:hypothetical protein
MAGYSYETAITPEMRLKTRQAHAVGAKYGIPVLSDANLDKRRVPQLHTDPDAPSSRVRNLGAAYSYGRIDYINRLDTEQILAQRHLAVLDAPAHTEWALWTGAYDKYLTMTAGRLGRVAYCRLGQEELHEAELDNLNRDVIVPRQSFYIIQALAGQMAISGFYEGNLPDFEAGLEIQFAPGQESLDYNGRELPIPEAVLNFDLAAR